MAVIPHRSPDDPGFVAFDQTRFRIDHGLFFLRPGPLRDRIRGILDSRVGWNLEAAGLQAEDNRLRNCLEWLETLADFEDEVVPPPFEHEPAIDLVAAGSIAAGDFERAACPACNALYSPHQLAREPWEVAEDGVTLRGVQTVCPAGHILHASTDLVDVLDLESPEP